MPVDQLVKDCNDGRNRFVGMTSGVRTRSARAAAEANATQAVRRVIDPNKPTRKQTRQSTDVVHWIAAEKKEMDMLIEKDTFYRVGRSEVPPGTNIVPTHWVYTRKADGRFKARLVVCGDRDYDYGDTFAPTTNKAVLWLLFALTVALGLKTRVLDITGAFVSADIHRTVYVNIDGVIYRLRKFLYGLRDSPKGFNDKLTAHLLAGGYRQSVYDQCLFYKWTDENTYVYVVIHVDDFSLAASTDALIDDFVEYLKEAFPEMTQADFVTYLGAQILTLADGSRHFSRPKNLQKSFDKWLDEANTMVSEPSPSTPMTQLYAKMHEHDDSPVWERRRYQELLGSLIQLIDVRPDISYAVSKLAQRTQDCREEDWKAMLRVVLYLHATQDLGLTLKAGNPKAGHTMVRLRGYADAAYACLQDGRSQYSYGFDLIPTAQADSTEDCVQSNTGLFHNRVTTGKTVNLSSTEAEICALIECVKTTIMLRGVLAELHQSQLTPTPVFNDNKSSITLATAYSGNHNRVRYILPKITWLMEQIKEGVAQLYYMETSVLPVDMGTKALPPVDFARLRKKMLGELTGSG